jgi:hypothetical protein
MLEIESKTLSLFRVSLNYLNDAKICLTTLSETIVLNSSFEFFLMTSANDMCLVSCLNGTVNLVLAFNEESAGAKFQLGSFIEGSPGMAEALKEIAMTRIRMYFMFSPLIDSSDIVRSVIRCQMDLCFS